MDITMIGERISQLRNKAGVSARDMSLSIGQSADYINKIENHRLLPSLPALFNICEYLHISLDEFFSLENNNPKLINDITANLVNMDDESLKLIQKLTEKLSKNNHKLS